MRSKFTQNERLIICLVCVVALLVLIPLAYDALGTDAGTDYIAGSAAILAFALWHLWKILKFQFVANRQRQQMLFEKNHHATTKYLDGSRTY